MIKNILLHHNFTRITSCIIGYALWAFIAQYQHMTVEQNVPICFYQQQPHLSIDSPDTIKLVIAGRRSTLYHFDTDNRAIHLDASQFKVGEHEIKLSRDNLFLPENINLLYLKPSYITINATKKDESK